MNKLNLFVIVTASLLTGLLTDASHAQALPDRLTLDHALSLAEADHPATALRQAEIERARAQASTIEAEDDLSISLNATARWVEPAPKAPDQRNEDHQASLFIRKQLYDFGKSSLLNEAGQAQVNSLQSTFIDYMTLHRIDIVRAFFQVVLADLAFVRENEDMATAYIRYDRARDRQKLGQRSELEVLEAFTDYQRVRQQRYESQAQQRTTRAKLAALLGNPLELPNNVERPDLSAFRRESPDYDELVEMAMNNNPQIAALKEEIQASGLRAQAIDRQYWPTLSSEFELSEYTRQFGSRDDWRASIILNVPVYNGDRFSSRQQQENANLAGLKARLRLKQDALRQDILELWTSLDPLRAALDQAQANMDYRDLYLDNARTLYQQDKRASLGDAMVQTSHARWFHAKSEFDLTLAWLTLEALTGQPLSIRQGSKNAETDSKSD